MRDLWRTLRLLVGTTVRTERWRAAAVLLEPLSMVTSPFTALALKFLTDGVVQQDSTLIVTAVAMIVGIQGVMGILGEFGTAMRMGLRERVGFAFDQEVARLTAQLPGIEHHERADYQDKLELLRQNQEALSNSLDNLINAISATVYALSAVAVLLFFSPWLLLISLLGLPSIHVAKLQERWRKEGEEGSARPSRLARHLYGLMSDRNAGMEIRVFGLHEEVRSRFRAAAQEAHKPVLRGERIKMWTDVTHHTVTKVGYTAAIVYMLWRAASGRASVGDVVATVYVCRGLSDIVAVPIFEVIGYSRVLRAARRLLWLRDYAESAVAQRSGSRPAPDRLTDGITFENVSFAYPGTDQTVLRNLSLTIPAGSVVALVGENGAGKTTLVKLLNRMYEPTQGRILVDGVDLADIDIHQWRARLSAAFQDFAKLELLAQQAVGVGDLPYLDEEAAASRALSRAGASDVVDVLPHRLRTQLGSTWDSGVDLSTGQWQKLALGRALMRDNPLVMFFDEPTASLDAPTEHGLFARYAEAARKGARIGSITVLVSHRFSTVRSADLILVVDDGAVTEVGSHSELMTLGGVYADLYTLQANAYKGQSVPSRP
jgi:ATP-binding cassette, subfamily B, bacterial